MELVSVSVIAGWQTGIKGTAVLFGPIFNNIDDLWRWQRDNIFTPLREARRSSQL